MNTIGDSTQDTIRDIGNLLDSSQRIGEILETISDISEQTNLLALNASIEAARAESVTASSEEEASIINQISETTSAVAGLASELEGSISGFKY